MNKNTVWLVVIVLLVGVIAGLLISTKFTGNSGLTGTVIYAGNQPETIQIGELDRNQLNKIVISEDKVVCYIKLGQGAGISCVPIQD